jgi:hypothetical protein
MAGIGARLTIPQLVTRLSNQPTLSLLVPKLHRTRRPVQSAHDLF